MEDTIYMVAGAPGSGKSVALAQFLALGSGHIAFDIDWLAPAASDLAGYSVISDKSGSKTYLLLWIEVLRCICRNNRSPILFSPLDPRDTTVLSQIDWRPAIEWLVLDCSDDVRRERLGRRTDWTRGMIDEAVDDAAYLRRTIVNRLDTDAHPPEKIARMILDWVRHRTDARIRESTTGSPPSRPPLP